MMSCAGKLPLGGLIFWGICISIGGALLLGSDERHDQVTRDNRNCSTSDALPVAKWVTPEEFIKDPSAYMVIGKKPLPAQLRGILWFTNWTNGPAMMSFGGPIASTPNDGCSSGRIGKDGRYCIRENGDGTFASASKSNLIYSYELARSCDKHLKYKFNSATNPTHADMAAVIGACPRNPDTCHKVLEKIGDIGPALGLDPEFTGIDMTLIDCVDHKHHLSGKEYPNSFCWGRRNWGPHKEGPDQLAYIMVQIVDEDGKPLEPAWSDFVAEQSNPLITGLPTGLIMYHDIPK